MARNSQGHRGLLARVAMAPRGARDRRLRAVDIGAKRADQRGVPAGYSGTTSSMALRFLMAFRPQRTTSTSTAGRRSQII